jgi:hypothetical protein
LIKTEGSVGYCLLLPMGCQNAPFESTPTSLVATNV